MDWLIDSRLNSGRSCALCRYLTPLRQVMHALRAASSSFQAAILRIHATAGMCIHSEQAHTRSYTHACKHTHTYKHTCAYALSDTHTRTCICARRRRHAHALTNLYARARTHTYTLCMHDANVDNLNFPRSTFAFECYVGFFSALSIRIQMLCGQVFRFHTFAFECCDGNISLSNIRNRILCRQVFRFGTFASACCDGKFFAFEHSHSNTVWERFSFSHIRI